MKIKNYLPFALILGTAMVFTSCLDDTQPMDQEVRGCMTADAVNYNESANVDDGSCVQVLEKQNSFVVKFTATWCEPCGSWGVPAFEQLANAYKGKILAVTAQVNDDLTTPLNSGFTSGMDAKYNYGGTPNFAVNNQMIGTNYTQANSIITTNADLKPQIATNLKYTIGAGPNQGKLNINLYIKAFEDMTGEYFAATYVVAKKIKAYQNGIGPDHEHTKVVLDIVNASVWGDPIKEGKITKGEVIHKPIIFAYDPSWNLSEISLQTVIWKKVGVNYEFVNCTVN